MTRDLDDETREGLEEVLGHLEAGVSILGGSSAPDNYGIPAIQSVPDAEHAGMGLFRASYDGKDIHFDAGGAMKRHGDLSWTTVKGDTEVLSEVIDYDIEEVASNVRDVLGEN